MIGQIRQPLEPSKSISVVDSLRMIAALLKETKTLGILLGA
jgi:hypothetical protein